MSWRVLLGVLLAAAGAAALVKALLLPIGESTRTQAQTLAQRLLRAGSDLATAKK